MKLLFDLFPVLLFFIAFKMADIYVATTVAIVATIGQIAWVWLRHRRVEPMQWVSLVIVGVFGGMTLALHDETFIKWKPTILYWVFAVALFASARFFGKNLIQKMLSEQMQLPEHVWARLNLSWIGFFVFMGIANLLVAFNFSTDDWVNFKLFGGMGLMLVFVVVQGLLLSKYIEEKP
ncbi:septation protein A [Rhodocyclus tenuis]|uniref:Inner membrane-spanning protein YciB n=1 Tax=Rhodocyclus tenuis TaxID=1066 RepID=A0A840G9F6_RHOTE|nr:septation protein A [Rhodocyclus tenuis]MBB4248485.1 intracellular septation protein [Rhodocyclus tenuis]